MTLFSPWKRDYINTEGLSLQDRFQVFSLNMTSRFVGMVIKVSTVLTYIILTTVFLVLSFLLAVVWIFYPMAIVFLIVYGFGVLIQ